MEGSRVRRRLVQSTLFPQIKEGESCVGGRAEAAEEEEDKEEECCGSGKKRRDSKRKANSKPKTAPRGLSKKVTENTEETSSVQVNGSDSPVISKSSFFVKASERRPQKGQQNELVFVDSPEENVQICSPPSSVANGKSTPRKLKRQDSSTPTKKRRNSTPNKKMKSGSRESCCGQIPFDLAVDEQPLQTIPDLRLEAKMTAEENSRIFAGKQIHPFFKSWKGGKTTQELTDSESKWCSSERKERGITFNPIHVFENVEDDCSTTHWGHWIFCERSAFGDLDCGYSPVYEGFVDSLNFDNFLNVSHFTRTSLYQNSHQCSVPRKEDSMRLHDQLKCSHPMSSLSLDDERVRCSEQQKGSYMLSKLTEDILAASVELVLPDHDLEENDIVAGSSCIRNLDSECQDKLLQERIMSHYHTCHNQPENCLWTDKYQPQNAEQICGNGESVTFLSEWLHLWHKRGSLASRSCINEDKSIVRDVDDDYQQSDSDSDTIDGEESLKNVLLVTGPVGSGKSAAIYACARDQGFQVIEINASDWRNGALVKQRFGEAVESHWLQRKGENATSSDNKSLSKIFKAVNAVTQFPDNEVIELVHLSDEEDSQDAGARTNISVSERNKAANDQNEIKTLILFEDVDATLYEDHGFITTIQQLAETAKRPMILTSNSDNPVLPKNLDRSELSFSVPSVEELLGLVYMITDAEKAKIHPCLVERFVDYCRRDIRKTIMLLQFWCQGQTLGRGNEPHTTYWPVPFDLDAGHLTLPKVIRWDYPSQLSELVEEEVVKSLILMEETHDLIYTDVSEDINNCSTENIHKQDNEPDPIEVKKEAMLSLHRSLHDEVDCARFEANSELFDFSCSPVAFTREKSRRKINTVLSSDSEDELPGGSISPVSAGVLNMNAEVHDMKDVQSSHCLSTEIQPICHSEVNELEENRRHLPERVDYSPLDDTCISHDISFVPESSFVPETDIFDGTELYSTTVSYGYFDNANGNIIIKDQDSTPIPGPAVGAHFSNSLPILQNNQEMLGNNSDTSTACVYQEEVGDSISKSEADIPRGYHLLDECSRVDFMRRFNSFDSPEADWVTDFVQNTWKKLHDQSKDFTKYVTAEERTARHVLTYAHATTNLISEADLLLKDCQSLVSDSLDSSMIASEETHSYSFYDNQLEMSSILAQHGMCFYAKEIASLGSTVGSTSKLDLASEMLSCSASSVALGKLASQDQKMSDRSETETTKSSNLLTSKSDSCLSNILKTVVPSKSYLAAKGGAFHEYISTLSQISRFEASRLSQCIDNRRQRRARVARHYLSSGSLAMSSEEISLLGQYNRYKRNLSS
ncbi:hypothetical protein BUALT_Bualt08G0120700 [Buddleja alternifolia]|uniref:AAA+ ATPase domain-containing protein n=1 Tax=Buddleja alternifolia TaxID=168488 RepID=A0AAV6X641_9LAMI|nr:hypothetical protein BUALT_Bualt08G0120700 [Buddleja alternifolia]